MKKDKCGYPDRLFGWLDNWIESAPGYFSYLGEKKIKILDELAENWKKGDQIELLKSMHNNYGNMFADLIEFIMKEKMLIVWNEQSCLCRTHTCKDLVRELWDSMAELGFEYTATETDEGIQIRCSRCPYNETVENDDDRKWLYHLFCSGDPYIVEGFNPQMGFRRTKTLIEGDSYCDHFYYMRTGSED